MDSAKQATGRPQEVHSTYHICVQALKGLGKRLGFRWSRNRRNTCPRLASAALELQGIHTFRAPSPMGLTCGTGGGQLSDICCRALCLTCRGLAGAGFRGRASVRVVLVVVSAMGGGRRFKAAVQKGIPIVSSGLALLERLMTRGSRGSRAHKSVNAATPQSSYSRATAKPQPSHSRATAEPKRQSTQPTVKWTPGAAPQTGQAQ